MSLPKLPNLIAINSPDFEFFRQVAKSKMGINFSDAKKELVQARLRSRVYALGLESFESYRSMLEQLPPNHTEWENFVNCLTTNRTEWFREPAHFEYIVDGFLPHWRKKQARELFVWSAACSTGEEPYSLSLVLNKVLQPQINFEILATDLDTDVLKQARNGVYPKNSIEKIPEEYRLNSFLLGTREISNWIKVCSHIKDRITFKPFNLVSPSYPWKETFDLILCRNVFIYFQKEVIAQVLENLYQAAAPGAILCIGHSESVQNVSSLSWTYVKPSILVKGSPL